MDRNRDFIQSIQVGDRHRLIELIDQDPGLVNLHLDNGQSALLVAIYYHEPEIAALLVERGAKRDIFGASALGDVQRVSELVEGENGLANAFAADGFQPLGLASFFGHLDVAEYLISNGAEVNSASRNSMRVMPLHSAVARGSLPIALLLLENGADVNAAQADGYTPLHEAAQNGQLEMLRLLLDHGALPSAQLDNGKTASDLASEYGHPEAANYILARMS